MTFSPFSQKGMLNFFADGNLKSVATPMPMSNDLPLGPSAL
jgi:hypothetical protein